MSADDIDAYAVQARKSSDKHRKDSDGRYLSVHLPEDIEDLDFAEGDSVYLKLYSSEIDGHDIYFLKGAKEEIGRHELSIRKRDDLYPPYFVSLPIEYTFHREGQSFHGLQPEDELNIELDKKKQQLRIYTAEDYRYRSKQLSDEYGLPPVVRQPVVGVPVVGEIASRVIENKEYARFADDVPTKITTNSSAEIVGEISGSDIDSIHLQRAEYVDDNVIWNAVCGVSDFEGESTKIYYNICHDEIGEYEYRITANYEEGETLNNWSDSDSDPTMHTGDEDLVSDVHTVTVVDSENE